METELTEPIAALWQELHPFTLQQCGFVPNSPGHYLFAAPNGNNPHSVIIFVPFIVGAKIMCHYTHLVSRLHSKGLFTFCYNALEQLNNKLDVGLVRVETNGKNPRADRLAIGLGFIPIRGEDGHMEFVWDSKNNPTT